MATKDTNYLVAVHKGRHYRQRGSCLSSVVGAAESRFV